MILIYRFRFPFISFCFLSESIIYLIAVDVCRCAGCYRDIQFPGTFKHAKCPQSKYAIKLSS